MTHGKIKVFAAGCALLALAAPVLAESGRNGGALPINVATQDLGGGLPRIVYVVLRLLRRQRGHSLRSSKI